MDKFTAWGASEHSRNTLTYAGTQRGVMCRPGLWRLLFQKTPHKANKSLTRRTLVPLSPAALLGRGSRKQAWSDRMDSRSRRWEGGRQGSNGGLRVDGQTGGWGGQKAAGRKPNRKEGQQAQKGGIMAGQRMAGGSEELEECEEFLTAEVTQEKHNQGPAHQRPSWRTQERQEVGARVGLHQKLLQDQPPRTIHFNFLFQNLCRTKNECTRVKVHSKKLLQFCF